MDARALETVRVLDLEGRETRLARLWATGPAVLVWLRHFGCIYCAEQARDFALARPDIEALGASLAFIGNGGVPHARAFEERKVAGCTVLTDPRLDSYRAIGARRGVLRTVGPQTWTHALRAFRRGARQRRVQGHPFQQGGVAVVARGGAIAYAYLSESAGDHPPVTAVLDALRGLGGEAIPRTA
jgi:peroxiredoxin